MTVHNAGTVHAQDGSRIGCGILESPKKTLMAHTEPLKAESSAESHNLLVPLEDGTLCFYGNAYNLEPSVQSFLVTAESTDCTAKNGCGVHAHSGTGCATTDDQGGHFYEGVVDPWLLVGYQETSAMGSADYVQCVAANVTDYEDRPFIVHANDGSRVSCGLMLMEEKEKIEEVVKSSARVTMMGLVTGAMLLLVVEVI